MILIVKSGIIDLNINQTINFNVSRIKEVKIMLYETLRDRKKELNITTEQLSLLSGVPVGTINKILNGETKSPRYDTLTALNRVLFSSSESDAVSEAVIPYLTDHSEVETNSKPKIYTVYDYEHLPDNVRAELIDGTFFFMEAPSLTHQDTITALIFEFELYIRSKNGNCKVFTSPIDVQLDCDNKTILQPDIVLSCEKNKRTRKRIIGAPDMCIEVTSASTRRQDYGLKVHKYMSAGVREYWIVDIQRKNIVCYYFESEDYPVFYTFQDKVPVKIYGGELVIDFCRISERIEDGI